MTIEITVYLSTTSTIETVDIPIKTPMRITHVVSGAAGTLQRFTFGIRDTRDNVMEISSGGDTHVINNNPNQILYGGISGTSLEIPEFDPILIKDSFSIDHQAASTIVQGITIYGEPEHSFDQVDQDVIDEMVGNLTKVQQTEVATRNREVAGSPYITTDNEGQQVLDPGDPYFQIKQKGFKQIGRAS